MKKLILFFIIFLMFKTIIAQNIKQTDWQWRNSNSTEALPQNKAKINTPITGISPNYELRLRLKVEEQDLNSGNGSIISVRDELRYTTTPDNELSWVSIGITNDGTVPFTIKSTNTNIAQDNPTTNQLGGATNSFYTGIYMASNSLTDGVNFYASTFTEIEWCITVNANAQPGTKYYFKEYGSTKICNTVGVGSGLPALTIVGVLPVKLTSFNLSNNDKKVSLTWTTASEQNNDRFEIMRSSDSKVWKMLTTIKGQGTTDLSNNYTAIDETPLNGINYYRIKQYNTNGSFNFSEIKALKLVEDTKSFMNISPNPAHGGISFSTIQNFNDVEVSLSNINGSDIYKEKFTNLSIGTINKLKLQKLPAPGLYILTLKTASIFEANKFIIY